MISLSHLTAGYGGSPVLKDISFSVEDNQNLSIIGPNGSGKTTLLRVLSGLIPYDGSAKLLRREVSSFPRSELAQNVALMEQIQPAGFSYTVYETVLLGRYSHSPKGLFSSWTLEDRAAVEQVLKDTHLWELKDTPITTLSGGQLQRVFFAQTLAQNPQLILLDEPTNHLDLRYQIELLERLRDWRGQGGIGVIGVFHDITLARELADRVLLLHQGEVYAFGTPEEVLTQENLMEVYQIDVVSYLRGMYSLWN